MVAMAQLQGCLSMNSSSNTCGGSSDFWTAVAVGPVATGPVPAVQADQKPAAPKRLLLLFIERQPCVYANVSVVCCKHVPRIICRSSASPANQQLLDLAQCVAPHSNHNITSVLPKIQRLQSVCTMDNACLQVTVYHIKGHSLCI